MQINNYPVTGTGGGCTAYARVIGNLDIYITGYDGSDTDLSDGWIVGVHDSNADCLWSDSGADLAGLPDTIASAETFAANYVTLARILNKGGAFVS
jgi:hypothetical protein